MSIAFITASGSTSACPNPMFGRVCCVHAYERERKREEEGERARGRVRSVACSKPVESPRASSKGKNRHGATRASFVHGRSQNGRRRIAHASTRRPNEEHARVDREREGETLTHLQTNTHTHTHTHIHTHYASHTHKCMHRHAHTQMQGPAFVQHPPATVPGRPKTIEGLGVMFVASRKL